MIHDVSYNRIRAVLRGGNATLDTKKITMIHDVRAVLSRSNANL